jgi:hypothetical protein
VPTEELALHGTGLNTIVVPWSVEGFGALAFLIANHFSQSVSNQFRDVRQLKMNHSVTVD